MKRFVAALCLALLALPAMAEPVAIKVGVLRQEHSRETLSILDIPATDDTLAGALLGVSPDRLLTCLTRKSSASPMRRRRSNA